MTFFQHLRARLAIWRLERRIEAAAESKRYHDRLAELAMGIAARDQRILQESRERLERITTALAQGVAA